MPWACRGFAVVFLAFGLSLISGKVAHTQDQSITSSTSMARPKVIPRPCGDRRPVPGPQRKSGSVREADRSDKRCAEVAFDRRATASLGHGDVREKANEDPVLEELKAMGEQGLVIERAREEVIEILEGFHRGCQHRLHDHHQRQRSFLSTPIGCAHCPERRRTGRAQCFPAAAP